MEKVGFSTEFYRESDAFRQSFSYKNLDHPVNHKVLSRVNLGWFRVTLGMFRLIQVGFCLTFFFNRSSRPAEKVAGKEKIIRHMAWELFKYFKKPLKYSDFVDLRRCN